MKWFYILAKKPGEMRAMMLASKGRTNLRVHALQFSDEVVEEDMARLRQDNPGWMFSRKLA